MEIKHIKENSNNILYLIGKLDAFQAETLERKLNELFETGYYQFIFEMSKIDYLSSAGIRVLVKLLKKSRKLGGFIKLSALKPYPYNVLKIAGFLKVFDTYPTLSAALDSCLPQNEQQTPGREIIATDIGELSYRKTSDQPVSLVISGSNQNYLKAICTKEDIVSKPLNHFQHALGIGSLGSNIDDNFNIMGELMIINGSVIWLPTDGHNRPDFLITTGEDSQINVHTAFNLSLQGDIQAVLHYQASAEKGCQLSSLYTELFRLAEKNFPHYKGMIGTIMRADLTSVYGAGIKKAPVIDNKPANNELITHADNIKEWLDYQIDFLTEPTSALIVGIGLDTNYGELIDGYRSVFLFREDNAARQYFHNHAALFDFMPERSTAEKDLTGEIDHLLEEGEFISMQHLLDRSRVKKAAIGLFCVSNIIKQTGDK